MENNSNSRWWEMYFVRYVTGSVVGAVIVYIVLKKIGICLIPNLGDIKSTNLLALGALGFAYCYLASAPITLLHATRLLYGKPGGLGWSNILFSAIFTILLIGLVFLLNFTYPYLSPLNWIAVFFILVVYQQAFYLLSKISYKAQWHIEYENLAINRGKSLREFIDSYRHLREHGNAFFIVLMEIALAFPLFMIVDFESTTETKIALILVLTVIWVIPGMICWFLGNSLERHMIVTPALQAELQTPKVSQYRRSNVNYCRCRR